MQPPSRGCVLKPGWCKSPSPITPQPPSRGCVLKHAELSSQMYYLDAAAFGRLCVETNAEDLAATPKAAAAFARLCVETTERPD